MVEFCEKIVRKPRQSEGNESEAPEGPAGPGWLQWCVVGAQLGRPLSGRTILSGDCGDSGESCSEDEGQRKARLLVGALVKLVSVRRPRGFPGGTKAPAAAGRDYSFIISRLEAGRVRIAEQT